MAAQKQIIAMGGGGFSMEPDNPRLEKYLIAQARLTFPQAERIKICFVPTASGDSDTYVAKFYKAMNGLGGIVEPSHITFFMLTKNLRENALSQHIIYVGGGNTRAMMLIWREWKFDEILREAMNAGIILTGLSAGSICWFEEGLSDSVKAGDLAPFGDCLGFLKGSHCPHYDGEKLRRPMYQKLISDGSLQPGYAADDGAALHFIDGALHRVVRSRPDASAFRVERTDSGIIDETILQATTIEAIV